MCVCCLCFYVFVGSSVITLYFHVCFLERPSWTLKLTTAIVVTAGHPRGVRGWRKEKRENLTGVKGLFYWVVSLDVGNHQLLHI